MSRTEKRSKRHWVRGRSEHVSVNLLPAVIVTQIMILEYRGSKGKKKIRYEFAVEMLSQRGSHALLNKWMTRGNSYKVVQSRFLVISGEISSEMTDPHCAHESSQEQNHHQRVED